MTAQHAVRRVEKKALTVAVAVAAIGFSLWSLRIFSDAYRAHMWGFIALWVIWPVFAYYVTRVGVEGHPSAAKSLKVAFVAISVFLSFCGLADYDQVRDSIGERYVSGYVAVRGDVDYDDSGRPYSTTDVYTDHWYSKFALWLFEWFFLAACIGIPVLTYKAAQRGADSALDGVSRISRFCPTCGTENPDRAKFCCKCGSSIQQDVTGSY